MKEPIKIALPKGRLLAETASRLQEAGWGLSDYSADTRLYHQKSATFPELIAKIFNEKDIPVQVAIGNYDLGICGLDWLKELLAKYPSSGLVKIKDLGYGAGSLYVYASRAAGRSLKAIKTHFETIRIASEYPNLAESFAAQNRMRRFSVFPLWGAAEVYPPENAELVLIAGNNGDVYDNLVPVERVMTYGACLVANRSSWETRDMSRLLSSLGEKRPAEPLAKPISFTGRVTVGKNEPYRYDDDTVRIALPDGHQQTPTIKLLNRAGIRVPDYSASGGNRRPAGNLDGVAFKVIRPQDMPLQVANGNFDLAVTGRDWLRNHLYQFPSSPVAELLDLKYGRVRIVAVVHNSLAVADIKGLRRFNVERSVPFCVASEYTNIADKYARDNRLGMYRIIPTWGATETFLPDDADMLIENTQTGKTLARHSLKIIDTLFESTACLIGHANRKVSALKRDRIDGIITRLSNALEES